MNKRKIHYTNESEESDKENKQDFDDYIRLSKEAISSTLDNFVKNCEQKRLKRKKRREEQIQAMLHHNQVQQQLALAFQNNPQYNNVNSSNHNLFSNSIG